MNKYSAEWFRSEAKRLDLNVAIYYGEYSLNNSINYVYFYLTNGKYRDYHNDAGPAEYGFTDENFNRLKTPTENYYMNNVFIGSDLKIYSKEELQNYLLLR